MLFPVIMAIFLFLLSRMTDVFTFLMPTAVVFSTAEPVFYSISD
ncbi:hypothetical protein [Kistimonas scapharcae]